MDVIEEKIIGYVGVDSGTVMLVDPCYVLGRDGERARETYDQVLEAWDKERTHDNGREIEAEYVEPWNPCCGIVVHTFYGDGVYPVIAEFVNGRIARVTIDFDPEDETEDTDSDEYWEGYDTDALEGLNDYEPDEDAWDE